ncbi:hypothetical protein EV361DRAFT_987355, partial [Lentinula raphanica]
MTRSQSLAPRLRRVARPEQEQGSSNSTEDHQSVTTNLGQQEVSSTSPSPTPVITSPRGTPTTELLTPASHSPSPEPVDSSSDDNLMASRTNATGRVDLGNGKHFTPKVVDQKGFNVFDLADLKEAIEDHAKLNKASTDADLKALWRKAWSDHRELLWFRTHRSDHDLLSMTDFLALIRSRFLGANWPSTIAESRQKLRMKNTGAGAFDEYVSELCALNDELANTNYHFDEKQLLAIISEGLIRSFRDDLIEANLDISPTTSLKTWKEKVDEWERRSAKWKNAPRRADMYPPNEMSSNKSHGKRPSGSYVNPSSFAASSSSSAHITMDEIRSLAAKSKFTKANLPLPLTSNDRALLALIEACFKCRTAYADHDSKDPNCPGCRLDVPYRPIDMRMVEEAQRRHKKDNCAITYNALLKAVPASKPAVGAIAPRRVVDDLSELDDPPISAPAAAVVTPYGSFPVSAVIP